MRTVVSIQEMGEPEIRPEGLISRFRELTEEAVREMLVPRAVVVVACPGCFSPDGIAAFQRLGMTYRECRTCHSLYISPRPDAETMNSYYRTSAPSSFWRERILPATAEARLEKVVRPRVQWVLDRCSELLGAVDRLIDLSTNGSAFVDELAAEAPSIRRIVMAGVTADLEVSGRLGDQVEVSPRTIDRVLELGPADAVTAFDVLDRAADVGAFMATLFGAVRPGGIAFLTAPSISGFDLQTLWERAPSLIPPERLNVLSLDGLSRLFAGRDWEILELSTPGMLDAESVRRAILAEPEAPWSRFIRSLLLATDERTVADFQEFLQAHRLASFARLLVRRRS